jgi:hypothetical protein
MVAVEVLFADGSTLHLVMRSTLDVQSDDLSASPRPRCA